MIKINFIHIITTWLFSLGPVRPHKRGSRAHVHLYEDSKDCEELRRKKRSQSVASHNCEELRKKKRSQSFASIKFYSDLDSTIKNNNVKQIFINFCVKSSF